MRYVFGNSALDLQQYAVHHAGQWNRLPPKVFDLLAYLLEHHNRVVTRQELFAALWPDQIVSDAALEWTVAAARRAVGDSGRAQRVIRTIHSRGYCVIVPVVVQARRQPRQRRQSSRLDPWTPQPDRPSRLPCRRGTRWARSSPGAWRLKCRRLPS